MLVADEQGLALHHHFHLMQVIAYEGRAAADDVEDAVCQSDARADLHRTCDNMDLGLDTVLVEELLQNARVGGGYLLAVEPLYAFVIYLFGDGERQTALGETES